VTSNKIIEINEVWSRYDHEAKQWKVKQQMKRVARIILYSYRIQTNITVYQQKPNVQHKNLTKNETTPWSSEV